MAVGWVATWDEWVESSPIRLRLRRHGIKLGLGVGVGGGQFLPIGLGCSAWQGGAGFASKCGVPLVSFSPTSLPPTFPAYSKACSRYTDTPGAHAQGKLRTRYSSDHRRALISFVRLAVSWLIAEVAAAL
jgi:hypothetical protein